ncbi:hypothetical protein EVAR_53027_1 [Eumeta japonica]|uniref:Uncharacterized protein n=1 Tax=Eumeta variegata TaxID=151549 RepID=A0A4C1XM29_EUMVA|nr:hypothetical protein EVAR_53027_1 [Eumeta japonica]
MSLYEAPGIQTSNTRWPTQLPKMGPNTTPISSEQITALPRLDTEEVHELPARVRLSFRADPHPPHALICVDDPSLISTRATRPQRTRRALRPGRYSLRGDLLIGTGKVEAGTGPRLAGQPRGGVRGASREIHKVSDLMTINNGRIYGPSRRFTARRRTAGAGTRSHCATSYSSRVAECICRDVDALGTRCTGPEPRWDEGPGPMKASKCRHDRLTCT